MWTGVSEKLIPVKMKNCDIYCPLTQYLKITGEILPDKDAKTCFTKERSERDLFTDDKDIDLNLLLSYTLAGDDIYSFKYNKDLLMNL